MDQKPQATAAGSRVLREETLPRGCDPDAPIDLWLPAACGFQGLPIGIALPAWRQGVSPGASAPGTTSSSLFRTKIKPECEGRCGPEKVDKTVTALKERIPCTRVASTPGSLRLV